LRWRRYTREDIGPFAEMLLTNLFTVVNQSMQAKKENECDVKPRAYRCDAVPCERR
jgi:hypothetical protein